MAKDETKSGKAGSKAGKNTADEGATVVSAVPQLDPEQREAYERRVAERDPNDPGENIPDPNGPDAIA